MSFKVERSQLNLVDGEVLFYEQFFSVAESDSLFNELKNKTRWRQDKISFYGKKIDLPRLTAWYGDPGKNYTYSAITMQPLPWTAALLSIKNRIDVPAGTKFNSVLLNLYRSGADGVAWHSDDEPELGPQPIIGSVSLGGTRRFQLRHKHQKDLERVDVNLTHGSLLIMRGSTQRDWQHRIPKTKKPALPRINLTFRVI